MSAAMVSAFNDFRDIFKHTSTQRATVDLRQRVALTLENRLNCQLGNSCINSSMINIPSGRGVNTPADLSSLLSAPAPKSLLPKHPPLTSSNSVASCSPTLCAIATNKIISSREHRKLDRSVSEPVDRLLQQQQQQQQPRPAQPNSSRYKTELCRPFEENGTCKYGDKCQFAHGINELRNLARHPKYKTELCRTFHSTGFCPYGPRCHFIHNSGGKKCMMDNMQSGGMSMNGSGPQVVPNSQGHQKDLDAGSFNLGSTGDLSSSSSCSSGSPTSLNGFFLDDGFSAFSPAPQAPQTAPPTMTNAFFFGQDYVPLKPLPPAIASQHSPPLLQKQQAYLPEPSLAPPIELLGSEMDKLNLGTTTHVPVSHQCGTSLDINRNVIRLPIFSRLARDSD